MSKNLRFASEKDLFQYLERVRANPSAFGCDNCILCGQWANGVGVFIPDKRNHERFGGKPDKKRMLFYGLCDKCWERDNMSDLVEAKLLGSAPTSN